MGEKLKKLRKEKGVTQTTLAKYLHFRLNTYPSFKRWQNIISEIENNKIEMPSIIKGELTKYFKVNQLYFEPIHVQLKELRNSRGYTQHEIGVRLGITGSGYSIYEKENHNISKNKLQVLANLYRKDLDWFTINYKQQNKNIKEKVVYMSDIKRENIDGEVFTERMRKLWKNSGLSQEELAKKIGMNGGTFQNYCWVGNNAVPTTQNLEKICNYFNITPQYFMHDYVGKDININEKPSINIKPVIDEETNNKSYAFREDDEKIMFSKRLRELWKRSGLKQAELAKKVGINNNTFACYLNLKIVNGPTQENMKKICDYFEVTPDYFIDESQVYLKDFNDNKSNNIIKVKEEQTLEERITNEIEEKFRNEFNKKIKTIKQHYKSEIKEIKEQIQILENKVENDNNKKGFFKRLLNG
ncbi:MAG: helix-turn-helix transcriptional regulator [archaeon]